MEQFIVSECGRAEPAFVRIPRLNRAFSWISGAPAKLAQRDIDTKNKPANQPPTFFVREVGAGGG